jgi:NCS1 family nucleobase:cation symporter-1
MIYFIILDPLTFDSSTAFLYMTASIPAILLAGVLHYVLSKMITVPKGLGAYGKP